jgi:hypothetical protein
MRENGIGLNRLDFRIGGSNHIALILTMETAHTDNVPRVRLDWKRSMVKGLCLVGQVEA